MNFWSTHHEADGEGDASGSQGLAELIRETGAWIQALLHVTLKSQNHLSNGCSQMRPERVNPSQSRAHLVLNPTPTILPPSSHVSTLGPFAPAVPAS